MAKLSKSTRDKEHKYITILLHRMHVMYIIMISETLLLTVINFSCLAQTQL